MRCAKTDGVKEITRAELEARSQQELVEIVLWLQAQVAELRARVEELTKPLPTSRNSSRPPSQDYKGGVSKRQRRRKRGAKAGHAKMERKLVERPDRIIPVPATECPCGADVRGEPLRAVLRRQLTELPEVKPVVIETQQHVVVCPGCGKEVRGQLPSGLEAGRVFGPRLAATVTYLQHQQHLSYERTQEALKELFGVELSEGGQACILERAGQAAQPPAAAIQAELRHAAVVGSDETSARVNGRNWWQWVFRSGTAVLHVVRPSRGEDVIAEVMGQAQVRVWVSDCWAPQLKAPARTHQLCLAHQLRNLQGLRERCPRLRWASHLQHLFRAAIHLSHRRGALSGRGFARRVLQLERQLARLLARPVRARAAQALVKRYRKHRAHLLVFLRDPTVPHHNNDCERALRSAVVHRKVSGGFRSAWGAHAYAALASVLDTAKARGQAAFPTLVALMGEAVLPFLAT